MSGRDARIVGDGPAGLVVALALARRGWLVSVTAPERRRARSSTNRIDVLGGSALPVLEALGIARSDFLAVAAPCPGRWTRWEAEPHAVDHFRMLESAWSINRPDFDRLLAERTVAAGVRFERRGGDASGEQSSDSWTIIATGSVEAAKIASADDRLVALLLTGPLDPAGGETDGRLIIEARPEGWGYAVTCRTRACVGVITDVEALRGSAVAPCAFVRRTLGGTTRIAAMLDRLGSDVGIHGHFLTCGRRPLMAAERRVRVGDARMTLDPLAGRGLWEAIQGSDRVATMLDETPDRLAAEESRTDETYANYLLQRWAFYDALRERYGPGFWARRRRETSDRRAEA